MNMQYQVGTIRNNREMIRYAKRMQEKSRRAREIRRNIALLSAAVTAAAICACFLVFGMLSRAAEENSAPAYKYYTSVTVGAGETLHTVAARYLSEEHYENMDEYLAEIGSINHLHRADGSLKDVAPGEHLIVPYYSAEFIR